MEFWILIAALAALIALFPFIRCAFKRIFLVVKLKKACKKGGASLFPARFLWFFGTKRGRSCDFYIKTRREIISVKLFGTPRRHCELIFTYDGGYFIRNFVAVVAPGGGFRYPLDGKRRKMPEYDLRHNFRADWELLTPRRILLVHPVCNEIKTRADNGREAILGTGQYINGLEMQTLSRLIGEING